VRRSGRRSSWSTRGRRSRPCSRTARSAGPRPPPGPGAGADQRAHRAHLLPAIDKNQVYDEHLLARRKPHFQGHIDLAEHPQGGWDIRTNALGLREDQEVPEEKADLRVLVVGDSHVDGLCANADSFPNLLEASLSERHPGRTIEVVNAGTGGWSFYNYLGALEGLAYLRPDVFVVVVYGGNDFQGAMSLHHFQRGERAPRPSTARWTRRWSSASRAAGPASRPSSWSRPPTSTTTPGRRRPRWRWRRP
jgi:hypothetical protein